MSGKVVVFRLEDHRYALPLSAVERIVRAVEITPLPGAPAIVMGVISVEGRVIPVLDTRCKLGLRSRDIEPADHLVIARTATRPVALVIDEPDEVIDPPRDAIVAADAIVPGLEHVDSVAKLPDGLVLIHDVDRFLSLDEARGLDAAIADAQRC
jgi:purine-binding chemotaxis protein CheW